MNNPHTPIPYGDPGQGQTLVTPRQASDSIQVKRVLRNTYALLAMTLLFSAGVAVVALTLRLPAPGLI